MEEKAQDHWKKKLLNINYYFTKHFKSLLLLWGNLVLYNSMNYFALSQIRSMSLSPTSSINVMFVLFYRVRSQHILGGLILRVASTSRARCQRRRLSYLSDIAARRAQWLCFRPLLPISLPCYRIPKACLTIQNKNLKFKWKL